jgi:hypothetical protein
VKDNETARVGALNNDRDQYDVVLEKITEDAIIERHESKGRLLNAYFERPGFLVALMAYLASSYDEIRDVDASQGAFATKSRQWIAQPVGPVSPFSSQADSPDWLMVRSWLACIGLLGQSVSSGENVLAGRGCGIRCDHFALQSG